MAKKITKKNFVKLDPSQIGKMKNPELRELLRGARQLYNSQEKTFKRYEKTVYSPALDKMQDFYSDRGEKAVSRMRRAEMQQELFRLQEFFDSKTATVPGARKVMLEQDKRIFGVNEKGKPAQRMTLEQRKGFWSAYNEFVNLKKESYIRNMGSDTIQQYLGQMIVESAKIKGTGGFDFTAGTFNELIRRLEEQKAEEDWEMNNYEYGDSNVLSGKRPY